MKPMVHAVLSAKKYGGEPEDYLPLHDWMDQTKAALPDIRHRMILHNSMGCFIGEQVFGHLLTIGGFNLEGLLKKFKNDPTPENAEAYSKAWEAASMIEGKRRVHVRDVLEDHVKEDLRIIPTIEQCLKGLQIQPWMAGGVVRYTEESKPQSADKQIVKD